MDWRLKEWDVKEGDIVKVEFADFETLGPTGVITKGKFHVLDSMTLSIRDVDTRFGSIDQKIKINRVYKLTVLKEK